MAVDFTMKKLHELYGAIQSAGYEIMPFIDYLKNRKPAKIIIVRHDVERQEINALQIAELEKNSGLRTSYYFRYRNGVFCEEIIKKISRMGHEIGYHYEDLTLAQGNFEEALRIFQRNLEILRQWCRVETICMHGSPFTQWDNRLIWEKYNYHEFDIIGEPYFDLDFNRILYLTDTGRRWEGARVNVRDKVKSQFRFNFRTTDDIIRAFQGRTMPAHIMMNIHPNRWNDKPHLWLRELIWQNMKNIGKWILVRSRT
ncbi:hypothetical protein AMJ52_04510 [candidate division TA06 bacterium DG_78]|uniref:NodB homology domain-containing protein n=1 Tax=candidate division TA06 bacterium DG_78 TaxID=1703772 RepID=A0A0S7YEG4_UNCT6|nr:MAG: hypothetical protein AMJ52_04510 [candidate division TA06 bacterium DG_78]